MHRNVTSGRGCRGAALFLRSRAPLRDPEVGVADPEAVGPPRAAVPSRPRARPDTVAFRPSTDTGSCAALPVPRQSHGPARFASHPFDGPRCTRGILWLSREHSYRGVDCRSVPASDCPRNQGNPTAIRIASRTISHAGARPATRPGPESSPSMNAPPPHGTKPGGRSSDKKPAFRRLRPDRIPIRSRSAGAGLRDPPG
jgi:hypothetical protein